jgi:hypothetical protein
MFRLLDVLARIVQIFVRQQPYLLLPTAKAFDGLSPIMCSPLHHKSRHERTIVWGCMVSKATLMHV